MLTVIVFSLILFHLLYILYTLYNLYSFLTFLLNNCNKSHISLYSRLLKSCKLIKILEYRKRLAADITIFLISFHISLNRLSFSLILLQYNDSEKHFHIC